MHYGLGVYLGTKGLYGFNQILVHADDMPGLTFLEYQDNIMCSFEDREQLDKADYDQIKALGLRFRGRNAWPLFRRYEPGFYPWPVNADECVFLTHALRQIPIVVSDLRKGQLRLDSAMKKMILRRPGSRTASWCGKPMRSSTSAPPGPCIRSRSATRR